jgi:hypothetical protein
MAGPPRQGSLRLELARQNQNQHGPDRDGRRKGCQGIDLAGHAPAGRSVERPSGMSCVINESHVGLPIRHTKITEPAGAGFRTAGRGLRQAQGMLGAIVAYCGRLLPLPLPADRSHICRLVMLHARRGAIDQRFLAPDFDRLTFSQKIARRQNGRQIMRMVRHRYQRCAAAAFECPDFVKRHRAPRER